MSLDNFRLPEGQHGTVTKKPEYLTLIQLKTAKALAAGHPRHHGVEMQAHHAISEKGMKLSDKAEKFKDFGYNINVINNLVFIPSTLPGACLLGVQPHRGNHTARSIDALDNDEAREGTYHTTVAKLLREAYDHIGVHCGDDTSKIKHTTQKVLDAISAKIIGRIQNKPSSVRLTKVSEHFVPDNKRGCGGMTSVNGTPLPVCPVHRNHTGNPKEIRYVCTTPYILRAGN